MALAAEKQRNKTNGSGRHRASRQGGGRHVLPINTQNVLSVDKQTAHEVPRTRRGRAGRAASILAIGLLAAVAPSYFAAEHIDATPPVTDITPDVQGLAHAAMLIYNQSEREHLGYDETGDHGKAATITMSSEEFGKITLTVQSSETQRGPDGQPEPKSESVTAVSAVGLLASGVNSATFVRTPDGNWIVSNTAPAGDVQERLVTELVDGNPITKEIVESMGELPHVSHTYEGNATAANNIAAALEYSQQLITANSQVSPNSPPQPQAPPVAVV